MKRNYKYILFFIILLIAKPVYAQSDRDIYYDIANSIDLFGRVYKEITLKYVDEIDPKEFMLAGIEGMLGALDPYTVYIDESGQKDLELMTTGKYGGIGATVGLRNDKVTVVDLIEGYSAQRQGLRIGDVIVMIDSVEVNKDNYNQLSLFMKGEPGTLISVTVDREGVDDRIVFNLVREEVHIKNLTYYGFLPQSSNNVYLKLSGFNRTAGEEIKDALLALRAEKEIVSIILDLRGNPGGLLDAAIDVADKFLEKNQLIVSVVGRQPDDIKEYYAKESPVADEADIIVLIDEGSASASEIVAGAIQDHDRGVILGEASFGKGLVQNVIPLTGSTSLKITTAKYLTPSGRLIQKENYTENSEVFSNETNNQKEIYRTDGNRIVYSGGGIEPDTVISNSPESELIQSLIAQGSFFKFATNYFNNNELIEWATLDKDNLFNSFKNYFFSNKFDHRSKIERLTEELQKELTEESYYEGVKQKFEELTAKIDELKETELDRYKNDVLAELHKEISARTDGRRGRVEASFNYDIQLSSAIELLEMKEHFSEILASAEKTIQ